MLIDSHCHLSFKDYSIEEATAIIKRAQDSGISHLINVGAGEGYESNVQALALAEQYNFMYATAGIHPHDAQMVTDEIKSKIENLSQNPKIVAIGECGLDFHYEHSPRDPQREVFLWQIDLAKRLGKPLMIHDRGAEDETYDLLKKSGIPPRGVMIHCFTGTMDLAKKYLELGCHLSFTGIITFKNSSDLREVVKITPLNQILIETDSPYLTPVPFRGKKNEPAYVKYVAEMVASVKGISFAEVAEQTSANAKGFFGVY